MKPAKFDYYSPASPDEALALLGQYGDDAKILAGAFGEEVGFQLDLGWLRTFGEESLAQIVSRLSEDMRDPPLPLSALWC